MRAVAFRKSLPATETEALVDVTLERPKPGPHDLLVAIRAVSVNPVDTKVRRGGDPAGGLQVLGFDAAGTVVEAGEAATLFAPGDEVFYAGSIDRPGTNAEFHLVDERIVGTKPKTLGFAEAAAMPLTVLTAWELLFDRIGVARGETADRRSLLVVGAAGGVGSMAVQLARRLTGLTVAGTASRPETEAFVRELGAHHVVDHRRPLGPQLAGLDLPAVDIVIVATGTAGAAGQLGDILAPEGHVGLIEHPEVLRELDSPSLFRKSIGVHLELMFTRPLFRSDSMIAQHRILDEVSALVDRGILRSTRTRWSARSIPPTCARRTT